MFINIFDNAYESSILSRLQDWEAGIVPETKKKKFMGNCFTGKFALSVGQMVFAQRLALFWDHK